MDDPLGSGLGNDALGDLQLFFRRVGIFLFYGFPDAFDECFHPCSIIFISEISFFILSDSLPC